MALEQIISDLPTFPRPIYLVEPITAPLVKSQPYIVARAKYKDTFNRYVSCSSHGSIEVYSKVNSKVNPIPKVGLVCYDENLNSFWLARITNNYLNFEMNCKSPSFLSSDPTLKAR
jgi:hypothetical protein